MRALVLLAAFLALPVLAADCPTPKPLTCEQLRAKEAQRCPPGEPCKPVIVDHVVQVPANCPTAPAPPACPPATERVVREPFQVNVPEKPKGHALVGGGVVWQNKWGLTALAGYQFKSGWQLMGGPLWIPHGDTNGEAVACLGKPDVALLGGGSGEPKCCISIPYHVQGAKPLGAQAVAVYVFK